jgi:hypothetical protein
MYKLLLIPVLAASLLAADEPLPATESTPAPQQATPLTQNAELLQLFEEHARNIYNRLPAMDRLYIHEGTGFTRETAWVVDGAELSQAPAAVVRLMFFIYGDEERFPIVDLHQDRLEIDGKIYLYTINTISYKGGLYSVEQWVDISAYWR